jgi:phosphatidylserine decarboxylase
VWFFRDPERSIPEGEGIVLSPADGCVTDVTRLGPESLLGRNGVQIGIFMSVFDVHVNRAPCQGRIEKIDRRKGTFLDARDQSAWQRNASATITMAHRLDGVEYPVIIRQIAGLIARRIVTDLVSGQAVAAGERIGMIKFGSRLEVLLPLELADRVCVQAGERVKAGQTLLAAAKKARTP